MHNGHVMTEVSVKSYFFAILQVRQASTDEQTVDWGVVDIYLCLTVGGEMRRVHMRFIKQNYVYTQLYKSDEKVSAYFCGFLHLVPQVTPVQIGAYPVDVFSLFGDLNQWPPSHRLRFTNSHISTAF